MREQTIKNWELIIVDDCSIDNTKQVVSSIMLLDNRVKYFRTMTNSGSPVVPRNFGVDQAQARYIAFLDSDDLWYANKLETQLFTMLLTGLTFSYHDMKVVKTKDKMIDWSKMSTCHSDHVFPFLLRKNFIPTSSVMMKKELYERYGPMRDEFTISHDWDLWLKIALKNKILFVNEKLGVLQLHKGSVITEVHRRRKESRKIVRSWSKHIGKRQYIKIMMYYYIMELFDIMPNKFQDYIRSVWYKKKRYK